MGAKWTVEGWRKDNTLDPYAEPDYGYSWQLLYLGDSLWKALRIFVANRKHYGCIKLELRSDAFRSELG